MADTTREQLRDFRARQYQRSADLGVRIEDLRREKRGLRTVGAMLNNQITDNAPLPGRERLVVDNPVDGSFDGINKEFTLTQPVDTGKNLVVGVVTQATGTVNFPTRTDHPAPGSGSYWFDGDKTIRIGDGDITSSLDRVFAVYIRRE